MIISVDELKRFINTTKDNDLLLEDLDSIEHAIRAYTHNNFQNVYFRTKMNASNGKLSPSTCLFRVGDTIQISLSKYNDGLYVIQSKDEDGYVLDKDLFDEEEITVTRIDYPREFKKCVVDIMRWKLKNEAQNYDENAKKDIQSETISRHSVTYAKDSSESDISETFGVPKKYIAFLRPYKKAWFE